MIIENYNLCKIIYDPQLPIEVDDDGIPQQPIVPRYKMGCEVKCFEVSMEELDIDLHLGISPEPLISNNEPQEKVYVIQLKNYTIYTRNYLFIYSVFNVLVKFKNGNLPNDYDFKKDNAEYLV